MSTKRVCIFCASSRQAPPKWLSLAHDLGAGLAQKGMTIVYGGASIGMMGAVADGALGQGGEVIGVIPKWLKTREVAHDRLTQLIVTQDMHHRKMTMYEMSDIFVTLPGGIGTLEETLEAMTWRHLGIHVKPVLLLNYEGFFDPMLEQFSKCVDEKLMSGRPDGLMRIVNTREQLLLQVESL